ncbi:CPBP family intramembrane glutamic endopeptidase [Allofustis seminis]|uniref:CPBP family intramembrane glutamic endopeptidase n=1 Tax=Allofustis seminis TaxID=166939 RepID=UPI00036DF21E|nr:type II CAAX endopeptidase family protein [Allofustis seminis]
MNFKHIKELLVVDMLTSLRQLSNGTKKEKITKKNVFRRVLLQNIVMLFVLPFMFSAILFEMPLNEVPGTTTYLIFSILSMGFFQMFITTYTLIFGENNFAHYMALPFTKSEFLVSKLCAVALSCGGFMFPAAIILALFAYQSGVQWIWGILFGLFSFVLFNVVLLELIIVITSFLSRLPLFQRYEKYIMLAMNGLMIAYIFYVSFSISYNGTNIPGDVDFSALDRKVVPIILPFLQVFTSEWMAGWIGVGIWCAVALGLFYAIQRTILKQLFNEKAPRPKGKVRKHKIKEGHIVYRSLQQSLRHYQLKQLDDTSLLLMFFFSKIYFPMIIFIPFYMHGADFMAEIVPNYAIGIYAFAGLVGAYMTMGPANLSAVALSLEKDNFYYIMTLPFSFSNYVRNKFKRVLALEWLTGALIFLVIALLLRVPLLIFLFFILGFSIGVYVLTSYYFKRDWRMLNLRWANVNELFSRGNQRVLMMFLSIFIMMIMVGAFSALIVAMQFLEPLYQLLVTLLIIALSLGLAFWNWRKMNRDFWPIFDGKLAEPVEYSDIQKESRQKAGYLSKIFYLPQRPLRFRDYVGMLITSSLVLQMIAITAYIVMHGQAYIQSGGQNLDGALAELAAGTTILSFPLTLGMIYWLKIPLFNRKQLAPEESVLIPGLTKKDWKFLAFYIPISFLLYTAGQWVVTQFFGDINPINQQGVESIAQNIPLGVLFLMIVVVAPIVEELLFRGMIMFRQPLKEPTWLATLGSALLFSLVHTPTDIPSFYTYFTLGLVFSYAVKRTKSVEAGMIYHMLNNLLGFLMILLAQGMINF